MSNALGRALETARKEQRLEQLRVKYADLQQPMADAELDEMMELLDSGDEPEEMEA